MKGKIVQTAQFPGLLAQPKELERPDLVQMGRPPGIHAERGIGNKRHTYEHNEIYYANWLTNAALVDTYIKPSYHLILCRLQSNYYFSMSRSFFSLPFLCPPSVELSAFQHPCF